MSENEISKVIVNLCYQIHVELGPGLFESVYEEVLYMELINYGFRVLRQPTLPVFWKGEEIAVAFKADLIVENKVIIELKSVETLKNVHFKQLSTYLKISEIKLGLLINFNEALIKNGIRRVVNNL
jgi:GxxExxY protein